MGLLYRANAVSPGLGRSPQPRLDLAFVSKAAQPFGLVQAAVSGVISTRSGMPYRADSWCAAIGFRGAGAIAFQRGFFGGVIALHTLQELWVVTLGWLVGAIAGEVANVRELVNAK
jgi:hypothetical protein